MFPIIRNRMCVCTRPVALLAAALLVALMAGTTSGAPGALDTMAAPAATAPTWVSYQGQVTVGGTPYTGTGHFKFAVVDQAGTTSYWSNDGSSAGGSQPAGAITLTVSSGQFNVVLGDTTLANMTQPLTATVFSAAGRSLRVWFSTDGGSFTQLSPDRRIASVPYALQAEEARNADTLDGQHSSDLVAAGSAWSLGGNAGTNPNTNYLGTSDGVSLTLAVSGTAALRIDTAGNVGLGADSPAERLTVAGSARVSGEGNPVAKGLTGTNLVGPNSVYVAGRYAYVTSNQNDRLAVFDVADPANPVAKGFISTNLSNPQSVYVSGRYAYVTSDDNSRLAVFDVSDPNSLVAKGYTTTNLSGPVSVYVAGRYAYVTSGAGLAVFDVADPNNLVAKGFTGTNLASPGSIYVAGRYAYVTSSSNNRLAVFDVSDPNNPVARGFTSTNLDQPRSVYVAGRYAYVASAYNDRLAVFDVSDPNNPLARGFTSTNLSFPVSVYVAGRYAYVTGIGNDRLAVFDIADPNNPVAKGYTAANLASPVAVYVAGRYAYVASWGNSQLAVFDLNHLESPTLETGSLWSGSLQVNDNAQVGNDLAVQGGLTVGPGGALVGGDLGVQGAIRTTVTSTAPLVVSSTVRVDNLNADLLDGLHASSYLTQLAGDASQLTNVPWTALAGVPAGFADNVDNDTTYSAGANLSLAGSTFALADSVTIGNALGIATLPAGDAGSLTAAVGLFSDYVKLGPSKTTCDAGMAGAVRWSSATLTLEVCDGTQWSTLSTTTPLKVAFLARPSQDYSFSAGSWQTITFATEAFDDGSAFSGSTFTTPGAGTYSFECQILAGVSDAGAVLLGVAIFQDGAAVAESSATVVPSGPTSNVRQVSVTVKASSASSFACKAYKSGSDTFTVNRIGITAAATQFSGHQIY